MQRLGRSNMTRKLLYAIGAVNHEGRRFKKVFANSELNQVQQWQKAYNLTVVSIVGKAA